MSVSAFSNFKSKGLWRPHFLASSQNVFNNFSIRQGQKHKEKSNEVNYRDFTAVLKNRRRANLISYVFLLPLKKLTDWINLRG